MEVKFKIELNRKAKKGELINDNLEVISVSLWDQVLRFFYPCRTITHTVEFIDLDLEYEPQM